MEWCWLLEIKRKEEMDKGLIVKSLSHFLVKAIYASQSDKEDICVIYIL